jgi:uncharacterized protein YxjI
VHPIKALLTAAVLACAVQPASAASLRSSDDTLSIALPGKWTLAESEDAGVVLLARKAKSELRVRAFEEVLSEKALLAKLNAAIKKLKKAGTAVPKKTLSVKLPSGGRLYFTQFASKSKKYRSGFFNFKGRSYGLLAVNLSNAEFKAISGTLAVPLPRPQPKPKPEPKPEPAPAPAPAAVPVVSTETALAPPPSEGALGAPSAAPVADLAPLPDRHAGFSLYLLVLVGLVSAGALGWRAVAAKKHVVETEAAPLPGAIFPYRIERHYLSFPIVFDVKDANGIGYRGVSYRFPALILGTGVIGFFALNASLQLAGVLGLDVEKLPALVIIPVALGLVAAKAMSFVGIVLGMFIRKKLRLYDAEGGLLLDVRQKLITFASLVFVVRDAEGQELARIKRRGFQILRRHWQLLDPQDAVLLDIVEDSELRALARKFLGHLWGILRTNYNITAGGEPAGELKREWSVWNRYQLHLTPPEGLDPRLALAAVMFVDIVDPDRWHPWHG